MGKITPEMAKRMARQAEKNVSELMAHRIVNQEAFLKAYLEKTGKRIEDLCLVEERIENGCRWYFAERQKPTIKERIQGIRKKISALFHVELPANCVKFPKPKGNDNEPERR